ncbi:MAG: hypothetical protein INR68_03595 [Methylobacterium mesophilicum]|nr:hypothetical protein [Methylobacterium mesophilicum]
MRRTPPKEAPERFLTVQHSRYPEPGETLEDDILSVRLWALNLDGVFRRCTRRDCRSLRTCLSPTQTPRLDCRGRPGPHVEARTEGMEILLRRLASGKPLPQSTVPRDLLKR